MHNKALPILYSYRRCPYAMRARMALKYASVAVEIIEINLREKPQHLLQVSPKATVPVLVLNDGQVIDQSLDIMHWALQQQDSQGWRLADQVQTQALILANDTDFKATLDRYKYPERYPEKTQAEYRATGEVFLAQLEALLSRQRYLCAAHITLADIAIFPFIRQFAAVDQAWYETAAYPLLSTWLRTLTTSELFTQIMQKQPNTKHPSSNS